LASRISVRKHEEKNPLADIPSAMIATCVPTCNSNAFILVYLEVNGSDIPASMVLPMYGCLSVGFPHE